VNTQSEHEIENELTEEEKLENEIAHRKIKKSERIFEFIAELIGQFI